LFSRRTKNNANEVFTEERQRFFTVDGAILLLRRLTLYTTEVRKASLMLWKLRLLAEAGRNSLHKVLSVYGVKAIVGQQFADTTIRWEIDSKSTFCNTLRP